MTATIARPPAGGWPDRRCPNGHIYTAAQMAIDTDRRRCPMCDNDRAWTRH